MTFHSSGSIPLGRLDVNKEDLAMLEQRGIKTTESLFMSSLVEVQYALSLVEAEAVAFLATVAAQVAPKTQQANQLVSETSEALALSSHVVFPRCCISELVAAAGVGKTQTCHTLASRVLRLSRDKHVLYIDTERTFTSTRLVEMLSKHADWKAVEQQQMLERVHILRVDSLQGLLDVLQASSTEELILEHGVSLVVVDSIASVGRGNDLDLNLRQSLLSRIASQLKSLACTMELAVVVTNQVYGEMQHRSTLESSAPALGLKWAHCVNVRYLLKKAGSVLTESHRTLTIEKSPLTSRSIVPFDASTVPRRVASIEDIILSDLYRKFEVCAERRTQQLVARHDATESVESKGVVQSWSDFACYAFEKIVEMLLNWRNDRLAQADQAEVDEQGKVLVQRTRMAIDIVFCESLLSTLDGLDKETHRTEVLNKILRAALEFFTSIAVSQGLAESLFSKIKSRSADLLLDQTRMLWAKVIGIISSTNLDHVVRIFLSDHNNPESITALQCLDLSEKEPIDACWVITQLVDCFEAAHGRPKVKNAICVAIMGILNNTSLKPDSPTWGKTCFRIYSTFHPWAEKAKHNSIGFPLIVAAICHADTHAIRAESGTIFTSLLGLCEKSKASMRLCGLRCIRRLMQHITETQTDDMLLSVYERLARGLFFAHTDRKKLVLLDKDNNAEEYDLIKSILHLSCRTKSTFAAEEVVFRLLQEGNTISKVPNSFLTLGLSAVPLLSRNELIADALIESIKKVYSEVAMENELSVELYRVALETIPWSKPMELKHFLCQGLIHWSTLIQDACFRVVKKLSSSLKAFFINEISLFALSTSYSLQGSKLLHTISSLINHLIEKSSEDSIAQGDLIDVEVHNVEAVGIVWLLSTSIETRHAALLVLRSCSLLQQGTLGASSEYDEDMPSASLGLFSIIERHYRSILHVIDYRSVEMESLWVDETPGDVQYTPLQSNTFMDELVNVIGTDQRKWSLVLGEMMRCVVQCESRGLAIALRHIFSKIASIQLNENFDVTIEKRNLFCTAGALGFEEDEFLESMFTRLSEETSGHFAMVTLSNCHWRKTEFILKGLTNQIAQVKGAIEEKKVSSSQRYLLHRAVRILREISEMIRAEHFATQEGIYSGCMFLLGEILDILSALGFRDASVYLRTLSDFAVLSKRLSEEMRQDPCNCELDQITRSAMFAFLRTISNKAWGEMKQRKGSSTRNFFVITKGQRQRKRAKAEAKLALFHDVYIHSITAMSSLLIGAPVEDPQDTLQWINQVMEKGSSLIIRDLASLSLRHLLVSAPDIIPYCIDKCYCRASDVVKRRYFMVIGDAWILGELRIELPQLINLIMFKLGDPVFDVRSMALDMIPILAERRKGLISGHVPNLSVLSSRVSDTYELTQRQVAHGLAQDYQDQAGDVLEVLWRYIIEVDLDDHVRMLRYCLPWVKNIVPSGTILDLLFEITDRLGDTFSEELENIWKGTAFAHPDAELSNIPLVLEYLLSRAMSQQLPMSSSHLRTSKRIALYLGRADRSLTVRFLSQHIMTSDMSQDCLHVPEVSDESVCSNEVDYINTHIENQVPISKGVYSLLLLVENAYEISNHTDTHSVENLAYLMHIGILNLYNDSKTISHAARTMLLYLLHSLAFTAIDNQGSNVSNDTAQTNAQILMDYLMTSTDTCGFEMSEEQLLQQGTVNLDLSRIVQSLVQVYRESCSIEASPETDLALQWAQIALRWTLETRNDRNCMQSYNIYQCLCPVLHGGLESDRVLAELLHCLEEASQQDKKELMETIIHSIELTIKCTNPQSQYPSIVWSMVYQMQQAPVSLLKVCINVLRQVFGKLQLQDPTFKENLTAMYTKFMQGPFIGLQPLALEGLSHVETRETTWMFLNRLGLRLSNWKDIIDAHSTLKDALLVNIIVQLPWICQVLEDEMEDGDDLDPMASGIPMETSDEPAIPAPIIGALNNLQSVCEHVAENKDLARCFEAIQNGSCCTVEEFLSDIVPLLKQWMQHSLRGSEIALTTLGNMVADGSLQHQRTVLYVIERLLDNMDWSSNHGIAKSTVPLLLTLSCYYSSPLRENTVAILKTVLKHSARSNRRKSAPPIPDLGTSQRIRDFSSKAYAKTDDDIDMTAPVEPIEDDHAKTFGGRWALQRRLNYSTHLSRLNKAKGVRPSLVDFDEKEEVVLENPKAVQWSATFEKVPPTVSPYQAEQPQYNVPSAHVPSLQSTWSHFSLPKTQPSFFERSIRMASPSALFRRSKVPDNNSEPSQDGEASTAASVTEEQGSLYSAK